MKRAKAALMRKLAAVQYRMWVGGSKFCWGKVVLR
jgi:hypothetical protein